MLAAYLAATLVVAATPLAISQERPLQDAQLYTLRANCTDEPWHGRHLVELPSSGRLGFENFTINPETPPLKFSPIRIRDNDNKYTLRRSDDNGELFRTAYLAALTHIATRTVSLKLMYLRDRLHEPFETHADACPKGYACTIDQWTFADPGSVLGGSQIQHDLRFGGFKGRWEPFKDAGKEGWHVYWKGNAGIQYPVQFDLVPTAQDENYIERRHKE